MSPGLKKLLIRVFLALAIGAGANILLGFFFQGNDLSKLFNSFPIGLAGLGFFGYFIGMYLIESLRLSRILKTYGYKLEPFAQLQNSVLGYFFSSITPMAAGGQPFQILHLKSRGIGSDFAANIFINRYVQHLGLSLLIIYMGFPFTLRLMTAMQANGGLGSNLLLFGLILSSVLSLGIIVVLLRPGFFIPFIRWLGTWVLPQKKWAEKLSLWLGAVQDSISHSWSHHIPLMLVDTFLGFANTMIQAFSLYLTFIFLGVEIDLLTLISAYTALNLLVFYFPTPGAAGGIEGIYSLAFGILSGDLFSAWAGVLLWRIGTFYIHIPTGLILLLFTKKMRAFLIGEESTSEAPPS